MKKILIALGVLVAAVAAQADIVFDNITGVTSGYYATNGTAGADPTNASNTITPLEAVKISVNASLYGGQSVTQFDWIQSNQGTAAVSARMRVRFYADNSNMPGSYITGYTFGATSINASSALHYYYNPAAGAFVLPTSGVFWAAITYDNNAGATGATASQLSSLGTFLSPNPPTVGTIGVGNNDQYFLSSGPQSGVLNNPAGSLYNWGVNYNSAWQFQAAANSVPEPSAFALVGIGVLGLAARRRKA